MFAGEAASLIAEPEPFASSGLIAPDVLRFQVLARERGCDPGPFTLDPLEAAANVCAGRGVALMAVPVPFGQYVPGDSAGPPARPAREAGARGGVLGPALQRPGVGRLRRRCHRRRWSRSRLSEVPLRIALRGLRAVSLLLAFTLVANALRWRPEAALVPARTGRRRRGGSGVGLFFVVRIVLLVVGTSLLTLTTSPVALTDALARVMGPLRAVRVPVDDIATMFSIALRFIPTTAEEAEKIVVAQSARGAVFDEGGLIRRAKAWVPVLVPLFVNLFRRADDLAVAMESRCYTGVGRTRLHEPRMRSADWIALVLGVTGALATAILF